MMVVAPELNGSLYVKILKRYCRLITKEALKLIFVMPL